MLLRMFLALSLGLESKLRPYVSLSPLRTPKLLQQPSEPRKVSLFGPLLKPTLPAEDHEIVLPDRSVIVIIVLLNVEFI